jgi:uncharacterized RDD family membrane protein YckC
MSNYGGGYGYPQNDGEHYRYPTGPPAVGSAQPINLAGNPGPDPKGKIGKADGGYFTLANWGWRAVAGLIDYGPLFMLYYIAAAISAGLTSEQTGAGLENGWRIGAVVESLSLLLILAIVGFNSVYLQGMTGQSVGKKLLGMQLVRGVTTTGNEDLLVRPGVLWSAFRQLLHVVDAAVCWLGFLAPLWTNRRQTFADICCNTVVLKEPGLVLLPFAPPGARGKKV